MNNLKLDLQQVLQKVFLILHKDLKVLQKLYLYSIKILNCNQEQIRIKRICHGSELPLHLIFPQKPVIHLNVLVLNYGSDNIDNSKLISFLNIKKLCVIMFRKHEPTISFHYKVYVGDLISLEVDVLEVQQLLWLEQRTEPRDERTRLPMEEVQALVSVFVNVDRQLKLKLVWQVLDEVMHVFHVFLLLSVYLMLNS